jgi:hypothetical protein
MKVLQAKSRKINEITKLVTENWPQAKFLKNIYKTLTPDVLVLVEKIPSMKALLLQIVPATTVVSRSDSDFKIIKVQPHFSKLLKIGGVNIIQNFFVSEYMLGQRRVPMSVQIKRRICEDKVSFIIDYTPFKEKVPYKETFENGYYLKIGTPKADWGDHSWAVTPNEFIALKEVKKI